MWDVDKRSETTMTSKPLDLPTVLNQLERLEKHNRRLTILSLAALAIALVAVGLSTRRIRQESAERDFLPFEILDGIRAMELSLVDASGNTQATLTASQEGSPHLVLWSPEWDERGNSSSIELRTKRGAPALCLRDRNKQDRAILRLLQDGSPCLEFRDEKGKVVWSVPGQAKQDGNVAP
jgi:hypothetical protein